MSMYHYFKSARFVLRCSLLLRTRRRPLVRGRERPSPSIHSEATQASSFHFAR